MVQVQSNISINRLGWFGRSKTAQLSKLYPDQPWRWKPEWERREIVCDSKSSMIIFWIVAVFWNGFCSFLPFLAYSEVVKKGNYAALFILLFPLVGIFILLAAIRATIRWRKFGRSVFALGSACGVIGGELQGTIRFSRPFQLDGDPTLTLSCMRRVTTGTGKERRTDVRTVKEERIELKREACDPRSGIAVRFKIPYGSLPTDDSDRSDQSYWTLSLHAPVEGVDFNASYEVPVFQTPDSDPEMSEASIAVQAEKDKRSIPAVPASLKGVSITPKEGGLEFAITLDRSTKSIVSSILFLCLLTAVTAACYLFAPIFVTIFVGFILLLVLLAVLVMLGAETKIFTSPSILRTTHYFFGFCIKSKEHERNTVREVLAKIGSQQGSPPSYNILIASTNSDQLITIARAIADKDTAEGLVAKIRESLGAAPKLMEEEDDEERALA